MKEWGFIVERGLREHDRTNLLKIKDRDEQEYVVDRRHCELKGPMS